MAHFRPELDAASSGALRFIDRYRTVVLDMGNTFMFGCDRFGADLVPSYRALGGEALDESRLRELVDALLTRMLVDARSGACDDAFGSVASYLARLPEARGLDAAELARVERVVALHEVGRVPEVHAEVIEKLSRTHPLGLISNVWSQREVFEAELRRAGVLSRFGAVVWSSDHGCIKPSPRLFRAALEQLGVAPAEAVYIGDNARRDVGGAKAAGMAAVWVRKHQPPPDPAIAKPDRVIDDLAELLR